MERISKPSKNDTMKTILLLAVTGLLTAPTIFAQNQPGKLLGPTPATTQPVPKGNGKIAGVILDAAANKAVEFATITLIDNRTGKTVDGTISDSKGRFSLVRIAAGQYKSTS